tara:strand:+ start:4948 stop:5847 length:900 start_codon:yes stop_codon:yes gene_type:complete
MQEFFFALWIVAIIGPLAWAWSQQTSVALGMVLSLLFGYIVQFLWGVFLDFGDVIELRLRLYLVPALVTDGHFHTLITSGFVHSNPLHVLGNILIISLVGIPLEDRLGRVRWLISYMVGLLGGSVAWTLLNLESITPALGASGAAFGILGAYLSGWPNDEVFFPLILIRKWPVQFIALFYFGFEIYKAWQVYGLNEISNIGHIAHFGGFILAYATLPILKKGIEWEGDYKLEEIPEGNPFEGVDDLVERLRTEGEFIETRQAWLEEIADRAFCPVCGGVLEVKKMRVRCVSESSHLRWP